VDDALDKILVEYTRLPAESVPLEQTLNRILANDVRAEQPIPAFPNSSMDGYAVRAADVAAAQADHPATLRLVMDIPAGATPTKAIGTGEAARIMTGAMLPNGADAVVPVEQTANGWRAGDNAAMPDHVNIIHGVKTGDYVRPIGEDIQAGQVVLAAGSMIRPQEIGVLAALGYAEVPVVRQPKVAILSSGDELVAVDQPLEAGKIRDTNSYTLAALIAAYGALPFRIPPARDTLEDVRMRFMEAIALKPDLIISSAGVSIGTFDVVRTVMESLGVISFWRVNLRPGKPLAYGHLQGIPFFGLPGNPVSAMVTFDVFVRPALLKLSGQPDVIRTIRAVLDESIRSDGRRSYIRVKVRRESDQWVAHTTGTQSSGALTSMVYADGLLIIPENVMLAEAGEQYPVRLLRPID
jgi:molybdopterin molybdotransferase